MPAIRIIAIYTGLLIVGFAPVLFAQPATTIYDYPLSERRVSYDIVARLDPASRTVTGVQRMTWRNPGNTPVDELQFHLYLNAFSGPNSTFMKESGGRHRGISAGDEEQSGGVVIEKMIIETGYSEGIDITDSITFIRPDDGNPDDYTVATVALPEAVAPGETVSLNVTFTSRLPKVLARTGWDEKPNGKLFFMVAQWFPKLGVYEIPGQRYVPEDAEHGSWNTHQFHLNSEWYADYGTYRVKMTVPNDYVVGASGVRSETVEGDSLTTYTYVADDVHDFVWTASNDYLEFNDVWKHVNIRLLIQPEHKGQVQRHFDAAKVGLRYFDEWYGEYPYTTLTLVDGLGGSNGVEYPTLITVGTAYGMPTWARIPELVVIHEFGHQYWYGLLGNNEFEEAWLDEGINSYTEMKIMEAEFGFGSVIDFPGFEISDPDYQRLGYTKWNPTRGAIFTWSWLLDKADYGKATYAKPATVLATLESMVGEETMRSIIRTYYDRWRFKHPTTRDFIAVANEVAGTDYDWFFEQFIYGTVAVDYAVGRIRNIKIGDGDDGPTRYASSVVLRRRENGIMPVDVLVTFDDGTSKQIAWDGVDEWRKLEFEGPAKVEEVFIDPDDRIRLDLNRLNNRSTTKHDGAVSTKYGLKALTLIQQLLSILTGVM